MKPSKLLIAIFIVQLIAFSLFIIYFFGIIKYGSPMKYRNKQVMEAKARADSIRFQEKTMLLPENAGDSTMYDISNHTQLFERIDSYESRVKAVQTALDSLKRVKAALEAKEILFKEQENLIKITQQQALDKNISNQAKIFDNMKIQQSVLLMKGMSDTLAVTILTLMDKRNSARLLGALAEADTVKAIRINKLLSLMGTMAIK
jgi:flagellar motility protein MotE (MotC chaperone)